ncbi:MAG: hypothetical protein J6B37_00215 [Clostridia bacterium]|nr:hypothetical protein [Clostridia bacterium]
MFQKLGLKDIFIEIWYRKFIIIGLAVLAVICAVLSVFVGNDAMNKTQNETKTKTVYAKTILVNIDAKNKSPYYDMIGQSQKLRASYLASCKTEYFAKYIQENIVSEKPIGDFLVAQNEEKSEIPDKNIAAIMDSLVFESINESTSIKLSIKCNDDNIGEQVLNSLIPYMENVLQEKLGEATFVEIDRTSYTEEVVQFKGVSKSQIIKDVIVKTIIFAVAFEFVYLAAVLLVVVFVPKVHTTEDIKAYFEVPVWEKK